MDEVLMDGGLNTAQLAVLDLLSKHSAGLTQREAAHALVLSETVMSTRVAGLVAGGLVERNALIGDRRAHLLRLTDKGREAAGVWSVCTSCIRHSAENAIAVEDLSTALSVLTRMTAALDAHDCSKTAHVGLPRLAPRTEEIPRPPSDGSPNKHAITIQDRHRRA